MKPVCWLWIRKSYVLPPWAEDPVPGQSHLKCAVSMPWSLTVIHHLIFQPMREHTIIVPPERKELTIWSQHDPYPLGQAA